MEKMTIYNQARIVPESAKKTIRGGRLSGMTDINPQWRIERLTELFGPVGFGWYPEITKQWLEPGADGVVCAFCNINLYVSADGSWSAPIPGTGGSAFIDKQKGALYTSDECFKMAYTDAISVAAKALGVGADVYRGYSDTKYATPEPKPEKQPSRNLSEEDLYNGVTAGDFKQEQTNTLITDAQLDSLRKTLNQDEQEAICIKYRIEDLGQLTFADADKIIKSLKKRGR